MNSFSVVRSKMTFPPLCLLQELKKGKKKKMVFKNKLAFDRVERFVKVKNKQKQKNKKLQSLYHHLLYLTSTESCY